MSGTLKLSLIRLTSMLDEMGQGLMKIVLSGLTENHIDDRDFKKDSLVEDVSKNSSIINPRTFSDLSKFKWNLIFSESNSKDQGNHTIFTIPRQAPKMEIEGIKLNLKFEKKLERISLNIR
jgi:hypothetical protein